MTNGATEGGPAPATDAAAVNRRSGRDRRAAGADRRTRGQVPSPTPPGAAAEEDEERGHELRAALFGIEASAEGLHRHREQLTATQFDELARCLVDEVRRVRVLLGGRTDARGTFDLAGAIEPVIATARASGLDVRSTVPAGVLVSGRRDSTAQVMLALLDNARKHAAPSPVEIRATVADGEVTLAVEDRGPGIGGTDPGRVFERGVRGDDSDGSGLGLFIARRLMADQHGSITVRDRPGGGASFLVRFPQALDATSAR